MQYNISDTRINEHMQQQAEAQGVTPDVLMTKLLRYCCDLGLIDNLMTKVRVEDWANKRMGE